MREILFRGKSIYTGKWAVSVCPHGVMHSGHLCDDFIPETVGQFTGLTDKNGKRIFEGDIINAHYANAPKADFAEQVVFCDGRFCSLFSTTDGNGKMWSALPLSAPHIKNDKSIYMEWCEVIGNIHDNPELLEVQTNA